VSLRTTRNVYRLSSIESWPDDAPLRTSDVPWTVAPFSAWLPVGGCIHTYTLGYNLSVSAGTQHGWPSGCEELLTVQNRSKVFHSPQILGTDFPSGPDSVQNLLSETSQDIRVFSEHRHRERSQTSGLSGIN